jgi:hypothetical protein
LEDVLRRIIENDQTDLPGIGAEAARTRWWNVTDRLSATDIEELVERRRSGVKLAHLAREYGISISSVQRLLRQRGVRRHPARGEVTREDAV